MGGPGPKHDERVEWGCARREEVGAVPTRRGAARGAPKCGRGGRRGTRQPGRVRL